MSASSYTQIPIRETGALPPKRFCGLQRTQLLAVTFVAVIIAAAVGGSIGGWISSQKRTAPSGGADVCSWESYRLPDNVKPVHYEVEWDLSRSFAPPFAFSGASAVDVTVATPSRCILVHVRALDIVGLTVEAVGGAPQSPEAVAPSRDPYPESDRVIIRLPERAMGAGALKLRFNFTGFLSDTVIGFYGSTYMNGSVAVPIVQTKFEPSFARTAFPCFDEPALKATFSLRLTGVPEGYAALGNMPALGAVQNGIIEFGVSPVMSTCE
jgi:aminopeptidase N